jgi:hypothetical protein
VVFIYVRFDLLFLGETPSDPLAHFSLRTFSTVQISVVSVPACKDPLIFDCMAGGCVKLKIAIQEIILIVVMQITATASISLFK